MPPLCRTGPFACIGTAPVLSLLRVDRLSLCGLSIEAPAASRYDLAAIGAARWRQRAGRRSALAHRCRRGAHSTEWLPHHAGAAHCSHSWSCIGSPESARSACLQIWVLPLLLGCTLGSREADWISARFLGRSVQISTSFLRHVRHEGAGGVKPPDAILREMSIVK